MKKKKEKNIFLLLVGDLSFQFDWSASILTFENLPLQANCGIITFCCGFDEQATQEL
jgi:hypothetical protein